MVDAEKFFGCRLCDDAAGLKKNDARCEPAGFAQIVSDEDDCLTETPRYVGKLALHFGACDRIESAEGLVHQEDRRVGSQGTSNANALPLSAGKLIRAAGCELPRVQAYEFQELPYTITSSGLIPALQRGHQRDVFSHREMWEKAALLNYVSDATTQGDRIPIRSCTILHEYRPFLRHQKPIYESEERGFAASAAAEQDDCFSGINLQRNIAHNVESRCRVRSPGGFTGYAVCHFAKLDGRFHSSGEVVSPAFLPTVSVDIVSE